MSAHSTRRRLGRIACFALVAALAACGQPMRVPLALPLPAVGGSRPASPQGLQLIGEFGDGLWGQEQERAEVAGMGVGFSMRDRIELSVSGYGLTRPVRDAQGNGLDSSGIQGLRGKVRFGDFAGGNASVGLHLAHLSSERTSGGIQDEHLTGVDVALPVTFYPRNIQFADADYRWGLYAGPRLVFQTFEDRLFAETTKGTLAAALLGVVARWRHIAVTGELNFAKTPTMEFRDITFESDWILLPMLSVRGIIPVGD